MSRKVSRRAQKGTSGWSKSQPKTRSDRREIAKRCGNARAFLLPNRTDPGLSKFPIIAKNSTTCAIDCRALRVATQRASMHGYASVERKARKLASKSKCSWTPAGKRRKRR